MSVAARFIISVVAVAVLIFGTGCHAQEKPGAKKPASAASSESAKELKVRPALPSFTGSNNNLNLNDHIIKNIIDNPFLSENNEYNKDIVPKKFNKNIVFKDETSKINANSDGSSEEDDLSGYYKVPYSFMYDDQSRYTCYIPLHADPKKEASEKAGKDEVKKEDLVKEMVREVLKPMDGKCLLQKNGGWWWYKYCRNKEVTQFHYDGQKNAVGDEYSLGKYNPDASPESFEFDIDKNEYSEMYTDGTVCDLTGKPRTVKVSFVCSPNTPGVGDFVSVHVKYGKRDYLFVLFTGFIIIICCCCLFFVYRK